MRHYLLSGRMVANVLVLAVLGVWFLTLAPTVFHGPAAYIMVSGHSMDGTYRTGDLVVTRRQDTYATGDIVAFEVANGTGKGQVIHRIIGGDGTTGYVLQGDNNPDPDPWHPTDADVVGRAWLHVPDSAWIFDLPRDPRAVGLAAGLITLVVLTLDSRPRRRGRSGDDADASHEAPPATAGR